MKIGINMGNLRSLGTASIGKKLITDLANQSSNNTYEIWVPEEWLWAQKINKPNINIFTTRPGWGAKFYYDNIALRHSIIRNRIERLLSIGDTGTLFCNIPNYLMVQQAYLAYSPKEYDFILPKKSRMKFKIMEKYFMLNLLNVSKIIVQTNDMKRGIASRWNFPEQRIIVIPSAIEIPSEEVIIKELKSVNQYVCYIASSGPHKNHIVLADMMAKLDSMGIDLYCIITVRMDEVPDLTYRARQLGILNRFIFLGTIIPEQVRYLLKNAVAMVMPSKLESYGLPYYEALAAGCPIVAADKSFSREACADAAIYVDANDGEAFAESILEICNNQFFRSHLSNSGKKRFQEVNKSQTEMTGNLINLIENDSDN